MCLTPRLTNDKQEEIASVMVPNPYGSYPEEDAAVFDEMEVSDTKEVDEAVSEGKDAA